MIFFDDTVLDGSAASSRRPPGVDATATASANTNGTLAAPRWRNRTASMRTTWQSPIISCSRRLRRRNDLRLDERLSFTFDWKFFVDIPRPENRWPICRAIFPFTVRTKPQNDAGQRAAPLEICHVVEFAGQAWRSVAGAGLSITCMRCRNLTPAAAQERDPDGNSLMRRISSGGYFLLTIGAASRRSASGGDFGGDRRWILVDRCIAQPAEVADQTFHRFARRTGHQRTFQLDQGHGFNTGAAPQHMSKPCVSILRNTVAGRGIVAKNCPAGG